MERKIKRGVDNLEPVVRLSRHVPLTIVCALGISISIGAGYWFQQDQRARLVSEVQRSLDTLPGYAESPLIRPFTDTLISRLYALRAAASIHPVDQSLLEAHVWDIEWNESPRVFVNFEYTPRVPFDQRDAFESAVQQQLPGFRILDRTENGLDRSARRPEYFPILYESTVNTPVARIGLDEYSNAMVQHTMNMARDTGIVSAYSRMPSTGPYLEFRYFLPVFRPGQKVETIDQRRDALTGFVVGVAYTEIDDAGTLVPSGLVGIETSGYLDLDGLAQLPPSLLEEESDGHVVRADYLSDRAGVRLIGRALPEMRARYINGLPLGVLVSGLLFTAIACIFLVRSSRRSRAIMELIEDRTRELNEQAVALSAANEELKAQNSERMKAEEALRDSEQRYRLLAENATDVIYTLDFDLKWTYVSPSVRHQRGWTVDEFMDMSLEDSLTPESYQKCLQAMEQSIALIRDPRGQSLHGSRILELEAPCKDGGIICLESTVSFLFDDAGVPIGVLGVSRDITRRKRAEEEKEELENTVRHTQKMEAIGTLAGGVAHDFNNLLTGILGYTDLIRHDPSQKNIDQGVDVIDKAAKRAQQLTGQLLGFARKGKFQNTPVDINESIRDVVELLQRTIDKNITVNQSLWDGEGDVAVMGDPGQIHQLLLNLGVNARDAMPEGGELTFETRVVSLDQEFCRRHFGMKPGTYNLIVVSDTGCGMSVTKQQRIFEPFFTDKQQGKGTGMGLAMVYGVTKSHGGVVTVHSQENMGSTFRVYLPHSDCLVPDRNELHGSAPVRGSGRILIVDDEEILRGLATEILGGLGYSVVTAEDGHCAVEYFKEHSEEIDLAIVDMIMPRMGGKECVLALHDISPTLPIIMSTGYSQQEVDFGKEVGLVGFIQKPFQIQQLSEAVAEALSLGTSTETA